MEHDGHQKVTTPQRAWEETVTIIHDKHISSILAAEIISRIIHKYLRMNNDGTERGGAEREDDLPVTTKPVTAWPPPHPGY